MDIQNVLVPQMTLLTILTASIVPLLIVAWLLAPLLCRLIVATAKVSVCTIPLIAIIALGFHLKRKMDAAEEERMRRIAAAEYEQRERMRGIAPAEYEQKAKKRQQEESFLRAQAQLQAEVQRRFQADRRAERRAEAERLVNIMRHTGVRPTTPPRSPPRQPELSGPAAWIANVFETIARASGDAAAPSGQQYRDSPAGASARPAVDTSPGGECVVCYDSAVDTLLMPCKHLALCGGCCKRMNIGGPGGRCPVCKTLVVDQIKVYRS